LGKNYNDGMMLTAEIAEKERIPKKFLELILLDLKKAGYVSSKQGAGGGYYLVKNPNKITVAEIYRLFDGAIALLPCVSEKFYERCPDCKNEKSCPLKRSFSVLRVQTYSLMSQMTLSSML
ncbi:MAG TPA: Rrf2 family transcriptional regulator, partial [Chitinophagales bacterium]|nr:Rrf2 family transcriptional regulator [Chitinophagales bacterium]